MKYTKIILISFMLTILLYTIDIINFKFLFTICSLLYAILLLIAFTEEIRIISAKISNIFLDLKTKFKKEKGIIGYKPIKKKHIAIIFPSLYDFDYPNLNSCEIKPLIEHYKKTAENYQIYLCYLVEDFINIVKNPNVKGLHIFGHGRIYLLKFKNGGVFYREFKGLKPKKDFVCQWHCNHGEYKEQHLGHIAKKYYIAKGYRHRWNNKKEIKKLIENKLDWKYNKKNKKKN